VLSPAVVLELLALRQSRSKLHHPRGVTFVPAVRVRLRRRFVTAAREFDGLSLENALDLWILLSEQDKRRYRCADARCMGASSSSLR
jgi:hypothetical protein